MTTYHIFKDVTPSALIRKPYRIAETIVGLDGARTRLTSFCYSTQTEAEVALAEFQQKAE